MSLLAQLSFGAPWVLAALIGLPVLWWLLRVTPPQPRRIQFPPLRLLLGLKDEEQTPAHTPWWLLLLRLIAAALLHDVGHLLHDLPDDAPDHGIDDVHEARAARWLSTWLPPETVEPVRMHVAAKRYLCAVESDYFGKLSPDSVRSLGLQGGPMSADEIEQFRCNPLHAEAVRLRRFDEAAPDCGVQCSGIVGGCDEQ